MNFAAITAIALMLSVGAAAANTQPVQPEKAPAPAPTTQPAQPSGTTRGHVEMRKASEVYSPFERAELGLRADELIPVTTFSRSGR
ncbi:hypothetical protein [Pseudooceanicola nanhaiensis]|uniref:hypothetical protein n=1 Tax=Pseudooceanicola nanhaiensis TaxID=375761 RepID=UPI001CD489D2|nr:hypothetical protein [Pseudooceanicola nanhaiensis]MCA0920488.1 hypothetical protein [Pseudooceanicola nanhaiensis]